MTTYDDFEVSITASWKDWRTAAVRFADLRNVHWHRPAGAPHPIVHAYVRCAAIHRGDLTHGCHTESAARELHVCVLRRHNVPHVYAELTRRADNASSSAPLSPRVGGSASMMPER